MPFGPQQQSIRRWDSMVSLVEVWSELLVVYGVITREVGKVDWGTLPKQKIGHSPNVRCPLGGTSSLGMHQSWILDPTSAGCPFGLLTFKVKTERTRPHRHGHLEGTG